MSLFSESKSSAYRSIRAVSQGASVTLLRKCDEYVATFACASSLAHALGASALSFEENIPHYRIPIEQMSRLCAKLAERLSVALVECICGDEGTRFILLWKIDYMKPAALSTDANDY